MAPPTKQARMDKALAEAGKAADEWRRLDYIARAARVKRDILLRRARAFGASFRMIEAETDVDHCTVYAVCKAPEPHLPEKETA